MYIYVYICIYMCRDMYTHIKSGLNVPFPIFHLNNYVALLIKILH